MFINQKVLLGAVIFAAATAFATGAPAPASAGDAPADCMDFQDWDEQDFFNEEWHAPAGDTNYPHAGDWESRGSEQELDDPHGSWAEPYATGHGHQAGDCGGVIQD